MTKSPPTISPEPAKVSSGPQPSASVAQIVPEHDTDQDSPFVQRALHALGGGSPETPPENFASAFGHFDGSSALQASMLRRLQRGYGNGYVGKVIQAKLAINEPGDEYEHEADRVAEQVMRMADDEVPELSISTISIQKKCTACGSGGVTCPECAKEDEKETLQTKAEGEETPQVTSGLESQINAIRGLGQPLPLSVRGFFEPRFGRDFSGVRVHQDVRAAESAKAINARAYTTGQDVVFGAGEYTPETPEGKRLLAHELTHTIQQKSSSGVQTKSTGEVAICQQGTPQELEAEAIASRVVAQDAITLVSISSAKPGQIQRYGDEFTDDESSEICEAPTSNIGTFVLDPALADASTPASMTTHIRVQAPMATGANVSQYQDRYVNLERPVHSAVRLAVFAVPLESMYETSMEAFASHSMCETRTLPVLQPGDQAWTASGAITVRDVRGNVVLTDEPNAEAVGGGAVIILKTDAGSVLIDAGLQLRDDSLAAPIGDEITSLVVGRMGSTAIGEAILSRNAPSGHVLPYIARQVQILSIRATMDQYDDGSIGAVLRAQFDYRQWYEFAFRNQLLARRAEWESTQPIAPNNSIREQRWNAHLEDQLASALREYRSPSVQMAEDVGGILHMRDDIQSIQSSELGAVPDLSLTQWEPADDEQIIVYGNGRLTLFPSRGLLLRPVGVPEAPTSSPSPRTVSGLHPAGQMGPSPATPQAVTPWMLLPAIGKEGRLLVRMSETHGVLVDAGGRPRVLPMEAIAEMATLGVTSIESILPTHTHADHVRQLIERIKLHSIRAENLVVARSWRDTKVIAELRSTTDAQLVRLRYGAQWREPGIAVAAEGVTRTHVRVGDSEIDVYGRGEAHRQLESEVTASRRGGAAVRSSTVDSASFLYVFGNESSSTRTAVMGDFRGEDIIAMHNDLGPERFSAALRNVRVIKGIGHHFSQTAGRTPADIRWLDLLLDATLVQNGELTILVQSSERFAFGGDAATTTGPEGALLRYLVRQGVRVVFAGRATDAGGGAVVSSSAQVTTYGTGAQILEGADPRVIEMHRRLDILREARRTVADSAEFGPTALEMEGRSADQLHRELQAEIERLEGLARELRGQAAADLLDARGARAGGRDWTSATERRAFRAANTVEGRTVEQILSEMAERSQIEQSLSEAVHERLRVAVASGRSVVVEVEFAAMPRAVHDAIEHLPEARRSSLAQKYREMAELTAALDTDLVPDSQRLQVLARATELRDELRLALEETTGARPAALDVELARLDSVVQRLEAETVREVEIGRDLEGRRTRTEYIRMRQSDLVVRGFHALGRGMGAMMVIHSVEQLGAVAHDAALGDINLPEGALRVAHSAYGMSIGVRLAHTTYRQAMTGTGPRVRGWEFAIMAVLEVGAAAAAEYSSSEERDAAIIGTAIHSSVNLICMYAGQAIMTWSATSPLMAHPLAKLAGMGLGLAVMTAGERILSWFGLDDNLQRWTSFPPGEVTHVGQEIGAVLNEYRIIIGSQQLQQRSGEELGALGVQYPYSARLAAKITADDHAQDVQSKERELTGLFEEGYERAQGSWVGLQMLDQQAAEFTRLRGLAMHGRDDPGRAALDQRWRQMDERLNLSAANAETIRDMEQWKELDDKLEELGDALSASSIDFGDIYEAMDELQLMIENARYRLDSASRGRYRPAALIPTGTEAHRVYTELLLVREIRLAGYHQQLVRVGGGAATEPNLGTNEIDPRAAYARLHTIRQNYDARVAAAAAEMPELARTETWAQPAELARKVEAANRAHARTFDQLRITEMALQSAARQTSSSLTLATTPPPPAALRQLIETEVAGVPRVIEARRVDHGLVFLYELDTVLEQRGTAENRIFAAEIDAAFPASRTSGSRSDQPRPFTDTEIEALHHGSFAEHGGGRISSTEQQLAQHRQIMAPVRELGTAGNVPTWKFKEHWERSSRVVDREYAILNNPYHQWDPDAWFDYVDEHSYDRSMTPIVAVVHGGQINFTHGLFQRVIAINADAVAVIGTGQPDIRIGDLQRITEDQILERAREVSRP